MNAKFTGMIAFAAGLLVPAVVLAQPALPSLSSTDDSSAVIGRLQKQEQIDEFEAKFWSQEPLTQQDFDVQEKEDRQLAARISAGEPVSHAELEQALERVETEY
jgi:hypothetical protein